MHELSICASILALLEEHALEQGYARVNTVRLEIGPLAAVEKAALHFAFESACRGTLADGARLEIIDLPAQIDCRCCGARSQVAGAVDPCPRCGSTDVVIAAGAELRIKDLEVT